MNKYFVIFGGGGIRGISYCGAYKALIENNVEAEGLAGSSIGAVFASLLSVKYSEKEIFDIMTDTGFGLFSDLNFDIKKELALSKGQKFYDWIKQCIEQKFYSNSYKKGKMPPVKFNDIDENLIIYAVDLAKMKFKEFSKKLTPDFEIALAVRASVSMPGLFVPLANNEAYLVDGDLLKSSPLWRLSCDIKNSPSRILEFRLEDNIQKTKITNAIDYVNRIYNAISGFATDYIIDIYGKKDKFDYIKINTPDVSVVDFLIPKNKKQELYDIGYRITNDYFKKILPLKREKLQEKYKKILDIFFNFQEKFLKKDYSSAYLILCEAFVILCEEKEFIDNSIYLKVSEFRNLFLKSYIKPNILNFNKGKLKDNKDVIFDMLSEILKVLTLKF